MVTAWFRRQPLKQKLTILFAGTSAIALFVACLALWTYEWSTYRQAMKREIVTMSVMLSDSSAAALAFGDKKVAEETLALLRAEPRVPAACLYSSAGVRQAQYGLATRFCPNIPGPERAGFEEGQFVVVRTARLNGQAQGALWLCADPGEMYARLFQLAGICAGVMLGAFLLAVVTSNRLQRLISGPIVALAAIAKEVSVNRDYSIRATASAADELGTLVERFNEMMHQVHQRDVALEHAQDELEERVRARTQELEEEIARRGVIERDLVAAKEAAEESNRAKSSFLANMSHELRTPLNAIIGYSELLQEDAEDEGNESAATDLKRIQGAARHLLEIIQDILDLSKIEAGRMDFNLQPMSARALISDMSVAQPLAARNGNVLVVEAGAQDYTVDVDPVRFRQSLLNLLSNACKFTERGTITLTLGQRVVEETPWVCWTVRDTGPGIAAGNISRLFQSFSQVDSSATRKHGGTGLGLAISQNFCRAMGGGITVESEPGVGSAFTIQLPVSQAVL